MPTTKLTPLAQGRRYFCEGKCEQGQPCIAVNCAANDADIDSRLLLSSGALSGPHARIKWRQRIARTVKGWFE